MALTVFFLAFFAALFRELMEHSRDDLWPKSWGRISKYWLNSGRHAQAWKNKHNWQPSWAFYTFLVGFTDGEHFFQSLTNWCIVGIAFVLADWQMALVVYLGILGLGAFKELFLKNVR